ncbi:MAG: DUF1836 domain-containing protein [Lachnospiraceae bacterium]|nr:DUF1836 domain-containing protein [Lachnospiraceae bacterium]
MSDRSRDILRHIIEEFDNLSYISPEDIPDLDLYMDQITTFMDSRLSSCKRHPEDKILTKTMINNYTKSKLIPPPAKKKYSKDHLLLLIFVYYLKDFLQISDIRTLLSPLIDMTREDPGDEDITLSDIYDSVFRLVKSQTGYMTKDLLRRWHMAEEAFGEEAKGKEGDPSAQYLQVFAFICLLSFDVYVKKNLIESIVDELEKMRK